MVKLRLTFVFYKLLFQRACLSPSCLPFHHQGSVQRYCFFESPAISAGQMGKVSVCWRDLPRQTCLGTAPGAKKMGKVSGQKRDLPHRIRIIRPEAADKTGYCGRGAPGRGPAPGAPGPAGRPPPRPKKPRCSVWALGSMAFATISAIRRAPCWVGWMPSS